MDGICCGQCLIDTPTVDVSYWPEPGADYPCVNSTVDNRPKNTTIQSVITENGIIMDGTPFTVGSLTVSLPGQWNPWSTESAGPVGSSKISGSSQIVKARGHPLLGDGKQSYVVGEDGFTYFSPSIYVAFHDVTAADQCGMVGQKHTSITLAFNPGELSSVEGPLNLGSQVTKSFNLQIYLVPLGLY